MVLRCVTLVGFLVPVLVIPLGLLALRLLGVVAIYILTYLNEILCEVKLTVVWTVVLVDVSACIMPTTVMRFCLFVKIISKPGNQVAGVLSHAGVHSFTSE